MSESLKWCNCMFVKNQHPKVLLFHWASDIDLGRMLWTRKISPSLSTAPVQCLCKIGRNVTNSGSFGKVYPAEPSNFFTLYQLKTEPFVNS